MEDDQLRRSNHRNNRGLLRLLRGYRLHETYGSGAAMTDDRIIKTYVWHKDKCFFVSTIERDSSALHAAGMRYNETIAWDFDWAKQERGEQVYQTWDVRGSISAHQGMVDQLYRTGRFWEDDE